MLRIYPFIVDTLREVGRAARVIAKYDIDLARQLRRAGASVALNTAEALGASAGNERLRLKTALGSAREVRARLDVAEAFEYVVADASSSIVWTASARRFIALADSHL
jgi:four helix bundle protein